MTKIFCPECGAKMILRDSKYGLFYGCSRYPECKGTHGAHQNSGKPLGTPADKETKDKESRTESNAVFESKDKQVVPFLLTQSQVKFLGTRREGLTIYFRFSPLELCLGLVNEFVSRKAPLVQPKDLLDSVESFRDMVFEMKEKRRNYEPPR